MKIVKMRPFPATRTNKKWSWTDKAQEYHAKMDMFRLLVGSDKEKIIKALIEDRYEIIFYIKMPESWSDKKKQRLHWQYHKQTPDTDNLFKAVTDSLFYWTKYNDSHISTLNAVKRWSYEDSIIFEPVYPGVYPAPSRIPGLQRHGY